MRQYGSAMADKLQQRVDEIYAVPSVSMMVQYRIGRCHALLGDRKGHYAVDLVHPFRLVFSVVDAQIEVACIEEIVDYH